jgi:hypothetical protein
MIVFQRSASITLACWFALGSASAGSTMCRPGFSRPRATCACLAWALLILPGCAADRGSDAVLASRGSEELARDSARAVRIATVEYQRENPGIPVRVQGVRREGEDYLVTFYPGGDWVGGGAVIRVKRDGRTEVEELRQ